MIEERMQPWRPDALRYQPPPRPASVALMMTSSPELPRSEYMEPELPRPVPIAPPEVMFTIERECGNDETDEYPLEIVTKRDNIEENRHPIERAESDSALTLQEVCVLHV